MSYAHTAGTAGTVTVPTGDIYEVVSWDEAIGESYGSAYLGYCVSAYGITL